MSLDTFSQIIGVSLIGMQAIIILGWLLLIMDSRKISRVGIYTLFTTRTWLIGALIFVGTAIIGSLVYSNLYELPICPLCWYQRMSIYPQVAILLGGIIYREYKGTILSTGILSVIGILISGYHYYLNIESILKPKTVFTPCDSTGISCADIPVRIFGYITIPFMTIVTLTAVLTILFIAKNTKKEG